MDADQIVSLCFIATAVFRNVLYVSRSVFSIVKSLQITFCSLSSALATDRVKMTLLASASTIYVHCCRRHIDGIHCDKIARVLPCLLTAVLLTSYIQLQRFLYPQNGVIMHKYGRNDDISASVISTVNDRAVYLDMKLFETPIDNVVSCFFVTYWQTLRL